MGAVCKGIISQQHILVSFIYFLYIYLLIIDF